MPTADKPKYRVITKKSFRPGALWEVRPGGMVDIWTLKRNNELAAEKICGKYRRYGWLSYAEVVDDPEPGTRFLILDYFSLSPREDHRAWENCGQTVIKTLLDEKIIWMFFPADLEQVMVWVEQEFRELVMPT